MEEVKGGLHGSELIILCPTPVQPHPLPCTVWALHCSFSPPQGSGKEGDATLRQGPAAAEAEHSREMPPTPSQQSPMPLQSGGMRIHTMLSCMDTRDDTFRGLVTVAALKTSCGHCRAGNAGDTKRCWGRFPGSLGSSLRCLGLV